jgi:hypothetical protein
MINRLIAIWKRRHWTTQVAVTIGAVTTTALTLLTPELAVAKEAVAFTTTMIWVWGP